MLGNLPVLGVRFDIEKAGGGYYGAACWKVFWRAVPPEHISGALLFEGDTAATLSGRENVFCIAVQSADRSVLGRVRQSLSASEEFRKVAAVPMFAEGAEVVREPLPDAGRVDSNGQLVGEAGASRSALGAIRREQQGAVSPPAAAVAARPKPASERTRDLPKVGSFAELKAFVERTFTPPPTKYIYWMTPEELCDVVEAYADLVEVQYSEYSCPRSEDLCCVRLFQKNPPEGSPIELIGLFQFPSEADVARFPQEVYGSDPAAGHVRTWAGIRGRYHLNFESGSANPRDITYEKENEIPAAELWPRLCARRQRLGIPLPTSGPAEKPVRPAAPGDRPARPAARSETPAPKKGSGCAAVLVALLLASGALAWLVGVAVRAL